MWAERSAWERVTEREEFVGRFSLGSRLPQYLLVVVVSEVVQGGPGCRGGMEEVCVYLTTAMFTGAVVLAR